MAKAALPHHRSGVETEETEQAVPARRQPEEPVWLVRIVLVLFLVGFAAFLAREVYHFVNSL